MKKTTITVGSTVGSTVALVACLGLMPNPLHAFERTVRGSEKLRHVGSAQQQLRQSAKTLKLSGLAALGVISKSPETEQRFSRELTKLEIMPPISKDFKRASFIKYVSQVANTPSKKTFETVLRDLPSLFASAGLTVRGAPSTIKHGSRFFLSTSTPPTLMPVEVRLTPKTQKLKFVTLDGHALRGVNTFIFKDDGKGGTTVQQQSTFQGSSGMVRMGNAALGMSAKQHQTWERFHAAIQSKMTAAR